MVFPLQNGYPTTRQLYLQSPSLAHTCYRIWKVISSFYTYDHPNNRWMIWYKQRESESDHAWCLKVATTKGKSIRRWLAINYDNSSISLEIALQPNLSSKILVLKSLPNTQRNLPPLGTIPWLFPKINLRPLLYWSIHTPKTPFHPIVFLECTPSMKSPC